MSSSKLAYSRLKTTSTYQLWGIPQGRGSGTKSLREEFIKSIESLIVLIEHEEFKGELLTKEITRETLNEPESKSITSKVQDLEIDQVTNYVELGTRQEGKTTQVIQGNTCLQLKTHEASFLPVFQGTKESSLFTISNTFEGGLELSNT